MKNDDAAYVLALYPSIQGLAFVLFESPMSVVDWGKTTRLGPTKNEVCITFVKRVIERYAPEVIVLEHSRARDSKRSVRVKMLSRSIATIASVNGIEIVRFRPKDIRNAFQKLGATTKHERSRVIASMLPAMSHRLPPVRKPWMAEDPRMALFEAAALGITYYGVEPKE